jgi:hypothetical protein
MSDLFDLLGRMYRAIQLDESVEKMLDEFQAMHIDKELEREREKRFQELREREERAREDPFYEQLRRRRLEEERDQRWLEEERQAREERDQRWRERELRERELRRQRKERERQERKERERQERKNAEYQKELETRFERESREAAEERRRRVPVDWRQALAEIRQRRQPAPVIEDQERWRVGKLRFDMELACNVFNAWECSFPLRPPCPLVADWRARAITRFNEWSRETAHRRKGQPGRGLAERARVACFQRRPTLSEYDNRRDGIVRDRYYFGIYEGQYSN